MVTCADKRNTYLFYDLGMACDLCMGVQVSRCLRTSDSTHRIDPPMHECVHKRVFACGVFFIAPLHMHTHTHKCVCVECPKRVGYVLA